MVEHLGGPDVGPFQVTIAEARAGSDPVKSVQPVVAAAGASDRMRKNKDVVVRPGDTVRGTVTLAHAPGQIVIATGGQWLAVVDVYGVNYWPLRDGPAVSVYDGNGRLRVALKLSELLGPEWLERYHNGSGSVWWLGGVWIDETDRELIIVGSTYKVGPQRRPVVAVRFDRRDVRVGGPADIVNAIERMNPAGLEAALDAAADMKIAVARSSLATVLGRESLPLPARLRAATALAGLGDRSGAALIRETCLAARKEQLDRQAAEFDEPLAAAFGYAIAHVPDVLGDSGLPLLRAVVEKYGYLVGVAQAFHRSGRAAVPALASMLDDGRHPEVQYLAAEALGDLGSDAKAAVPELARALAVKARTSGGPRIDGMAATALGRIGPAAAAAIPALRRLAADPDTDVRERANSALERIQQSGKADGR